MDLGRLRKLNIPKSSGCYLFKDRKNKIIYIGKAADLRSRIISYWQKSASHTPAKYSMLKQVRKIDWIKTDSEIEALLLEANLIKKYQPSYNVALRDDKRFVYIKISVEEEWPRVFITRRLERSGKYFGPFVSTEAVRATLKAIRKIWPYRSCARLPKKVCLYFRIGKCPGMCERKITKQDYKKIIKQISLFLEGKKGQVIKEIEKEIKKLKLGIRKQELGAEEESRLAFLQYQLVNINKVLEHSKILSLTEKYAADVVELTKILGLTRVPARIEGYDISNIFGKQAVGSMVVFSQGEPDKSQYRKFKIKIGQGEANDVKMLGEVIERRFKHTSPSTPSLIRREEKGKEWPLPDLIIVDGGKAQLNLAVRILKKFKLDIPVLAISKGKGLRSAKAPDKIFFPKEKKPLELSLASPALHLIKRVRDEAHRFAISYHRLLRKKRLRF